jgi:hypothetical protein
MKEIILFMTLLICISGCKDKRTAEIEKIVKEWTGKTIVFPEDLQCKWIGQDTVCPDLFDKPYKILTYIDSSGCSSCKLRLSDWKVIINEIDLLAPEQVSFLFYIHPKDEKELTFLLKRDQIDYPVFVDVNNKIEELNHFPQEIIFQSFLLDQNNQILLIGNPVMNPAVWKIYKQQITEEKNKNNYKS